MTLVIAILWVVNFAICWWNAKVVGSFWDDAKEAGFFPRLLGWAGLTQSAAGFTWCYSIVLLIGAFYLQPPPEPGADPLLTEVQVNAGLGLAYLLVIPGILLSGLVIWADSMVQAWRRRDMASVAVAGWNSFAQVSNMAHAVHDIPQASSIAKRLFDGDSKEKGNMLVLVLVAMSVLGGLITTYWIFSTARSGAAINRYARKAA